MGTEAPTDAEAALSIAVERCAAELRSFTGRGLVFLVGAPRSGTTWLQRVLASHPGVRTGQESGVFGYLGPFLRRYRAEVRRRTRKGLAARPGVGLGAYLREEDVVLSLRFVFAQMLAAAGVGASERFLEKSPRHAEFLPEIHAVFPEARLVHLLRDPRDVIASLLVAGSSWGRDWAPAGPREAAERWSRSVEAVLRAREDLPSGTWSELRYEQLCADPERCVSGLARFLGLEWSREGIAAALAANAPDRIREGGGTAIPLHGRYRDHFGPVVEEPPGFAGGGRRWGDLPLRARLAGWRGARRTAGRSGYPSDLRSWLGRPAPAGGARSAP